jgi:ribose/xylose/arabinose/galactoside ABC-type transport system permease subunit
MTLGECLLARVCAWPEVEPLLDTMALATIAFGSRLPILSHRQARSIVHPVLIFLPDLNRLHYPMRGYIMVGMIFFGRIIMRYRRHGMHRWRIQLQRYHGVSFGSCLVRSRAA